MKKYLGPRRSEKPPQQEKTYDFSRVDGILSYLQDQLAETQRRQTETHQKSQESTSSSLSCPAVFPSSQLLSDIGVEL